MKEVLIMEDMIKQVETPVSLPFKFTYITQPYINITKSQMIVSSGV